MRALSIRQPWAWLILHAGKDIENRDWATGFRGRVLVHAGKTMTRGDYEACELVCSTVPGPAIALPAFEALERGGVVGAVEIVDCVTASSSPWFFGEFGFVLRAPQPLPFLPWKGRLQFFDVPAAAVGLEVPFHGR